QQYVFIVDRGREIGNTYSTHNRVVKFNHDGKYVDEFPRGADADLSIPIFNDVLADDSFIYAVGYGVKSSSIVKYDLQGNLVKNYTTALGNGAGILNYPNGLTIDKDKDIFVANTSNSTIEMFSSNLDYSNTFGSFGTGNEQFNRPFRLSASTNGKIYIADYINKRIQIYSK
ncbi:MAG: hypothetical protein HQK78_18190, partial [Desulfobacterales bacterium]|nr:hypothetical protein [Desulfobacterales bacterium]